MKVVEALRDSELRRRLRRGARQLIEERYSPAATALSFERLYQSL
jgi:glycosyltransferase involved in cell wall biosynthesis